MKVRIGFGAEVGEDVGECGRVRVIVAAFIGGGFVKDGREVSAVTGEAFHDGVEDGATEGDCVGEVCHCCGVGQ
ncbi:hypothetical protein JAO29_21240 [Edaphobacter sp. HDX4]|uniref:hypothetical protein n=1 Tax=Edaphobacter sp. HDX4 TaxID=2794064 RepID=UPI002FE5A16A